MSISLMDLKIGQAKLEGELKLLRLQQEANHKQNRDSIHDIRDRTSTFVDRLDICEQDLLSIKLFIAKVGGWAVGAGAVVALVVKIIDHLWK